MMEPYDVNVLNDTKLSSWKDEMSRHCRAVALHANQIATIDPMIPTDIKNQVNMELNGAEHNVAMLPDEISRGVLQIAGGHLYKIGEIFKDSLTSPMIVAPLVRCAVENCSLVIFINEPADLTIRSARAMRSIQIEIEREGHKDDPVASELYNIYRELTKAFTKKRRDVKINYPKYTNLVEQTLSQVGGKKMYHQLCSYTHHSSWMAFQHFHLANQNPSLLNFYSLRFAALGIRSVLRAMLSVIEHKPEIIVNTYKSEIEIYANKFDNFYQIFFEIEPES